MNFGTKLIENFGQKCEKELHPHIDAEQSSLYSSIDSGSTEIEVLNFLNALVYLFKPKYALETGTFLGLGSIAIASAMKQNGFGVLHTVETNEECILEAKQRINHFDKELNQFVKYHCCNSLDFIDKYSGPAFDFVFFDSDLDMRHLEFRFMRFAKLLAIGAICVFHDTSRTRNEYMDDQNPELIKEIEDCSKKYEHLYFPYSRGLDVIRITAPQLVSL